MTVTSKWVGRTSGRTAAADDQQPRDSSTSGDAIASRWRAQRLAVVRAGGPKQSDRTSGPDAPRSYRTSVRKPDSRESGVPVGHILWGAVRPEPSLFTNFLRVTMTGQLFIFSPHRLFIILREFIKQKNAKHIVCVICAGAALLIVYGITLVKCTLP